MRGLSVIPRWAHIHTLTLTLCHTHTLITLINGADSGAPELRDLTLIERWDLNQSEGNNEFKFGGNLTRHSGVNGEFDVMIFRCNLASL